MASWIVRKQRRPVVGAGRHGKGDAALTRGRNGAQSVILPRPPPAGRDAAMGREKRIKQRIKRSSGRAAVINRRSSNSSCGFPAEERGRRFSLGPPGPTTTGDGQCQACL